ncbi:hypothetical protein GGX14DRAFT_578970 [Mycena pura]|uniref:Uncharacterized protein n=1 Tax=Mycena pura TaxID=153505 RepID=A0AAD6UNY2_9AGAR|nr:hypothetical protein GGX14DRAFT_578970 [Mycena pura]
MEPVRRCSSRQSVHSWWSDSNPLRVGATIPLHTLAKPLMKEMYHRQALSFIAERALAPLSAEFVDILVTYLVYKDIFPSTRALVLAYLDFRARESEAEAQMVVDGCVLDCAVELLKSSHPGVLRRSCSILEGIARHHSLKRDVIELQSHLRLSPLLIHKSKLVREASFEALNQISCDGSEDENTIQVLITTEVTVEEDEEIVEITVDDEI